MRILGIDPGYGRLGWGVIQGQKDQWAHVAHGCIETDPKRSLAERLLHIAEALREIITKHNPDAAGVEELFFKKNVTTGLSVAHARGVVLLELQKKNLRIAEIKPAQIKQAITGYGNAEKSQVQAMVSMMLKLEHKKFQDDAADALAVALASSSHFRPGPKM